LQSDAAFEEELHQADDWYVPADVHAGEAREKRGKREKKVRSAATSRVPATRSHSLFIIMQHDAEMNSRRQQKLDKQRLQPLFVCRLRAVDLCVSVCSA